MQLLQTAIYYGIKHFCYIACYIAENRLYTMLNTMLYGMVSPLWRKIYCNGSSQEIIGDCLSVCLSDPPLFCRLSTPIVDIETLISLYFSKSRVKVFNRPTGPTFLFLISISPPPSIENGRLFHTSIPWFAKKPCYIFS